MTVTTTIQLINDHTVSKRSIFQNIELNKPLHVLSHRQGGWRRERMRTSKNTEVVDQIDWCS